VAGKLSRLIAIFKTAPRQIIAAYRKGYSEAPGVPPPQALRERQASAADPPPPAKDLPPE
jgi:hypothetical protein